MRCGGSLKTKYLWILGSNELAYSNSILGNTAVQTGCFWHLHAGQEDDDWKEWGPRKVCPCVSRKLILWDIYLWSYVTATATVWISDSLSLLLGEGEQSSPPYFLPPCHAPTGPNQTVLTRAEQQFTSSVVLFTTMSKGFRILVSILWEL